MKKVEISIELLRKLYGAADRKLAETVANEFPEVFGDCIEVGKWVVSDRPTYVFVTKKDGPNFNGYGIYSNGDWFESESGWDSWLFKPVDDGEMFEVLKEVAIKKEVWDVPLELDANGEELHRNDFRVYAECFEKNRVWSKYGLVFCNGKWATPKQSIDSRLETAIKVFEDAIAKADKTLKELRECR